MARRTSARSTRAPIIEEAASTAEAVATSPVKRAVKKRKLSTNAASPVVDGASTSHEVALPDETASTVKVEVTVENVDGVEVTETSVVKKKEKRAPRQKGPSLEDEVWPERHWNSKKYVGAHVSSAGGADNSPLNACRIGAACFALFLKSQRQWAGPAISEATLERFPLLCDPLALSTSKGKEVVRATPKDGRGYDFDRLSHVVPHGCYLVNLANPDPPKWDKALSAFIEELERAESLGIGKFNFHPGSTTGLCSREEGIAMIAKGINIAHERTKFVKILIENMAGKGNMIGGLFSDLSSIISLVTDKSRVGVCLDTCHAFASGYDLRTRETYEATMEAFGNDVGWEYLGAVHMNDSKAELGSHRDLHENIGLGKLGLMPFFFLMNDPRFDGIPLILETVPLTRATSHPQTPMLSGTLDPSTSPGGSGGVWVREIRMLHMMEGLTGNGDLGEVEKLRDEIREMVEEQERVDGEKRKLKGLPAKGKKAKGKAKKEEDEDEDMGEGDVKDEDSDFVEVKPKKGRGRKQVKVEEGTQVNGTNGRASKRKRKVVVKSADSDSDLSSLSD